MITAEQYTSIQARIAAFNAWQAKHYPAGKNGYISYPTDAVPTELRVTNEERSSVEVYEFVTNPPQRAFVYINEADKRAATWTGETLGSVSFGRSYRSNMGDKRIPVALRAINGKMYVGTYYESAGNYARVKMVKG